MAETYYGKVVWFSGGYGFIEWEKQGVKQKDIFVHYSDIASEGYKTLKKDQVCSFSLGLNNSGIIKAVNVTEIKK